MNQRGESAPPLVLIASGAAGVTGTVARSDPGVVATDIVDERR